MATALDALCRAAENAVRAGFNIPILSDRAVDADNVSIPALLATSAVHHTDPPRPAHRTAWSPGAAIEVHHFATLAGYGAEAINPTWRFDTIQAILPSLHDAPPLDEARYRYVKAVGGPVQGHVQNGHLHLPVPLRCTDIFDAVGLSTAFVNQYFTGHLDDNQGYRSVRGGGRGPGWHRNAAEMPDLPQAPGRRGDYAVPPAR